MKLSGLHVVRTSHYLRVQEALNMRYGVAFFGLCLIIVASYKNHVADDSLSLSSVDNNFQVLSYISKNAQAQYPREYKKLSNDLRTIQADCRRAPRFVYKPGTSDGPISRGENKSISKVTVNILTKNEFRLWRERQNFIPDLIQRIELQRSIIYKYLDEYAPADNTFFGADIGFDNTAQLHNSIEAFYDYLHQSVEEHKFGECVDAVADILGEVKDV
jgi:hypothetical protein